MAKIDSKGSNTQMMMAHKLKQKHDKVGKINEIDLGVTDVITFGSSKVLNSNNASKLANIMRPNPNDSYLTSDPDVDSQIMIKLVFRDPVSLTHILFRATKGPTMDDLKNDDNDDITISGPREIKLFANKPQIDFTDAEDMSPSQSILLKESDLKGKKLSLKSLKFQRCNSLQIFIVDNQNDCDVTFINRIGLIGRLTKQYHTNFK
mmetsp:Transcript_86496/g.106148  ORF Transcript_86496/g.106148 Transcript_86496/m.106148 type:complete len:206 (-) Transcript_86496:18-635(-)